MKLNILIKTVLGGFIFVWTMSLVQGAEKDKQPQDAGAGVLKKSAEVPGVPAASLKELAKPETPIATAVPAPSLTQSQTLNSGSPEDLKTILKRIADLEQQTAANDKRMAEMDKKFVAERKKIEEDNQRLMRDLSKFVKGQDATFIQQITASKYARFIYLGSLAILGIEIAWRYDGSYMSLFSAIFEGIGFGVSFTLAIKLIREAVAAKSSLISQAANE
jgi:uncharacterized coiled-coil protein SlyX